MMNAIANWSCSICALAVQIGRDVFLWTQIELSFEAFLPPKSNSCANPQTARPFCCRCGPQVVTASAPATTYRTDLDLNVDGQFLV